jgi:hypothetical protein
VLLDYGLRMFTEIFAGKKPITENNFSLIASIMPVPGRIRIRKDHGAGTQEFLTLIYLCDPAGRFCSFGFFTRMRKRLLVPGLPV